MTMSSNVQKFPLKKKRQATLDIAGRSLILFPQIHVQLYRGGPTLFLSVDFVKILPKTGGGQTLMFTKALTKF